MPLRTHRATLILGALLALGLSASQASAQLADLPVLESLVPRGERPVLRDLGLVSQTITQEALHQANLALARSERVATPMSLTTASTWTDESNIASRQLGRALSTAGDVNGDGISDFVALGDNGGSNAALYLYFGSAAGPTLAAGYPVTNLPAGGEINAAGDVNGDGYGDVVLYWYITGHVRVYFGGPTGFNLASFNSISSHFGVNLFGFNAAPAGDIDNDGYDDLIFGMPNLPGGFPCAPQALSGVVEVMYGSSTGVSVSSIWLAYGCTATGGGSQLGASVAGAGDVNGDGFADIVFGAPTAADLLGPGGTVGKVYVMYGAAGRLPVQPGFSNLGSVNYGSMILGHHGVSDFGASVSTAGDLNGDGFADIAIGAPSDDNFVANGGFAYVYRGTSTGIDSAQANILWSEAGPFANTAFGRMVVPAGDINGDGRPDLLVGQSGSVAVAQSTGSTFIISQSLGYPAGTTRVAPAGDVNGDGLSDVVAGEQTFTNGESSEGRVSIHLGVGSPPSFSANWTTTQSVIDNPNLGWSVASAGDVNGDGYDDVLVGAPTWYDWLTPGSSNNGLILLFYGHSTGLSPSYDWYTFGANDDQLGLAVASAGDVNGDGYGDFIVSAHTWGGNTGQARLWYGSSFGPNNAPNVTLTGFSAGGYFGAAVACAGDVNGDGYPDVVVGAPYGVDPSAPLTAEGRAYVYLGGAGGLSTTPIWSISGRQANAHLGTSVAGAGDVNADTYGDIVIGVPEMDNTDRFGNFTADAGRVIVAYGSAAGPNATQTVNVFTGWRMGASVAGAGDVNGDGYSDIIVGAPNATNTQPNEGAARVYGGGPGGLSSTVWIQYGGEAFGGFGSSVSSAGDVDGDGLSDVLVGAVFQDQGGPQDQGRAYVYRGPLPNAAAPFWTGSGGSSFANLGHVVANAGDVNGDGWSDLMFGLPGYNGTGYRQGFARVHMGAQATALNQVVLAFRQTPAARIIHAGTLTNPGQFLLFATGRSAAGRTKVRMQHKVSTVPSFLVPAIGSIQPTWTLTGVAGATGSVGSLGILVNGLTAGVPYAWEMRALSKSVYFPTGIWRSPTRNARREADLRAPGTWVDVAAGAGTEQLMLGDVHPNPMRTSTTIAFALTRGGPVSLDVVDVQGRRVRELVQGVRAAGEHRIDWDGRDDDGHAMRAGIYFLRLHAEDRSLNRKVVVMR